MYKHLNQEHYGEHWMQLRVQSSSPPWPVHAWTPSNKMSNTSKISKENTLTSNISEKNHTVTVVQNLKIQEKKRSISPAF